MTNEALINAAAEAIRATGFTTLANEFISRPDMRARIVVAMRRNIARDRNMGPVMAENFYRLAAPLAGLR